MASRLRVLRSHTAAAPAAPAAAAAAAGGGRFAGRAVVITGAGGGLGKAAAQLFVEEGAKVLCVDINAAAAAAAAKRCGASASALTADVSSEEDAKRIIDTCCDRYGRIDVYFANAGLYGRWRPPQESSKADFERALQVNLVAPFLAIKYAAPRMKAQGGGAIVCTTSIAAIRADIAAVEYSASKAGIAALVRASQDFLLADGVRVNAVMPGGVMTPMALGVGRDLGQRGLQVQGHDMRRFPLVPPADIARVALWLASPESSAVKGQVVVADGGMTNSMGLKVVPMKKKARKP